MAAALCPHEQSSDSKAEYPSGSESDSLGIQTPIEADFLSEFKQSEENVDLLQKLRAKYGQKRLSQLNRSYSCSVERIINALTARGRGNELFPIMEQFVKYFDDYDLGNIVNIKLEDEALLNESWPVYMFGHDHMGHPVFYDEVIGGDGAKIFNVFQSAAGGDGEEGLLRLLRMFRFKFYAKLFREKQAQSDKYGTTIFKHILVHDAAGFSYLSIVRNISFYVKVAKTVMTDEQFMYPESLYRLLVVNCPPSFMMLWKVVSTVLDPKVLEKIKILGTDFLDEMLKDIAIDQIPQRYGGSSKWKVRFGDVPDMSCDE